MRPYYGDEYDEASDILGDQWVSTRNSLQGKEPTADQLLDYWQFDDQLDSLLKYGQNISNMDTADLDATLYIIDGPGNEYGTGARIQPIKDKITNAIKARQNELALMPAYLAIKETKQLEKFKSGQKLDVDKILKWQADYKAGRGSNLIPATVLEKVKGLTDVSISQEDRLTEYTGLLGVVKQFGNDDQQRVALGQLRNHIKQNANPALAALTDLWETIKAEPGAVDLFKAASNIDPQTSTDIPGSSETSDATFQEIKQALVDMGKTIGYKTTMADESQIHDHIALERAIIRS